MFNLNYFVNTICFTLFLLSVLQLFHLLSNLLLSKCCQRNKTFAVSSRLYMDYQASFYSDCIFSTNVSISVFSFPKAAFVISIAG